MARFVFYQVASFFFLSWVPSLLQPNVGYDLLNYASLACYEKGQQNDVVSCILKDLSCHESFFPRLYAIANTATTRLLLEESTDPTMRRVYQEAVLAKDGLISPREMIQVRS